MVAMQDPGSVKVYTVNGAASGSSSSLPDWLTRRRAAKKGKRAIKERLEGTIDLVQEFEFPEASNRIKTTRDGHHAIATGVYKPQMRCYDLDQLTLKFERHSDAENVDFIILSDDWTKTLLLQADRSLELHTQGGFHYRTRIPRFGRSIAYHFPTCDTYVGASGNEVYRLNLDQGRFLNPLVLEDDVVGVNAVNINPAHQLLAFGTEGAGTVEFWDPRSRTRVGQLRIPSNLASHGSTVPSLPGVDDNLNGSLSVTAISSRTDGLSYAVGTSTGHTLLYDIRSPRPYAVKDLGYGLPVKSVSWLEGGSKMAGDGMILSADRKVIKIWDRTNPEGNFASITPPYDVNDVHHLPATGMLMVANEGIQMSSYYIPQLGPAPRWCSFLDNITEEMEDQTVRNVYEDYKFIERSELERLGLDHLVGTPALKPYMHGYFLSLRLYDAARAIANPFAYEEHKARRIQEKVEKLTESRIRTRKNAPLPKVNKALAERIHKEEERAQKAAERKLERTAKKTSMDVTANEGTAMEVDGPDENKENKKTLLNDPRFSALFDNPEFEVDETSREFGLLNPSLASQRTRGKSAVENEDSDDSSRSSSEGSKDGVSDEEEPDREDGSSEDDVPELVRPSFTPGASRARPDSRRMKMVPAVAHAERASRNGRNLAHDKDASFGQRRRPDTSGRKNERVREDVSGDKEFSWIPSSSKDDSLSNESSKRKAGKAKSNMFGMGLERGLVGEEERKRNLSENERHGRKQRRRDIRSGSKNAFRT